jgi:hypothetical protein
VGRLERPRAVGEIAAFRVNGRQSTSGSSVCRVSAARDYGRLFGDRHLEHNAPAAVASFIKEAAGKTSQGRFYGRRAVEKASTYHFHDGITANNRIRPRSAFLTLFQAFIAFFASPMDFSASTRVSLTVRS